MSFPGKWHWWTKGAAGPGNDKQGNIPCQHSLSPVCRCGGTLVSSLHVISAAHCTVRETPDSMEVILGKHWSDAKGTRASNEGSRRFYNYLRHY